MRVLLTGATGVLGSEVRRQLRAVPGAEVTAVSSRGSDDGVLAWPMGRVPPPAGLDGPWDVVVHTAADTRWNLGLEEARSANVASAEALRYVVGPGTHLLYVSTMFAGGVHGSTASADPADYHNTYEWSKAAAERMVTAEHPAVTIVRPPMILGRRSDGHATRFVGFYTVMKAALMGLAPLIVAEPDAHLELVPVDDIARLLVARALGTPPDGAEILVIGRGAAAYSVRETLNLARNTLNGWRAANGVPELTEPPLIPVERWERFFLPLARVHLTERQQVVLDSLGYFVPYMSFTKPFDVDVVVDDVAVPLERAVRYWAERNRPVALREVRRWSMAR